MGEVRLSGQLICADETEGRLVREHLPRHIVLTRAEPGCLAFSVVETSDPLVWQVEERFTDEAAFAAHQSRAAGSEWGARTAGIERRYSILGLADGDAAVG